MIDEARRDQFLAILNDYASAKREMPWRDTDDPYLIMVSEIMLQQTGVERVRPKYESFIEAYPSVRDLARADLADVLRLWQGLGYNRRARYLHDAAKMLVREYDGRFPRSVDELVRLPGIGKNTAGAIVAYAFNGRVLFVETNVRTVFFHHFFDGRADVGDSEITAVLGEVLPDTGYREFYWALMDYGTYLKRTAGGRLDSSKHYVKQSPLKGSVREVRGLIIKCLAVVPYGRDDLRRAIVLDSEDARFTAALDGLLRDGLVSDSDGLFRLAR